MSRTFSRLVAAVLLAGAAAPPGARDAGPYPPGTVLLFVAGWCAPCRGEVARLDAIAAAARPWPVRAVLYDDTRAGREMLRGLPAERRWTPDAAAQRRMEADVSGQTAGLPYSIMTDADGRPCASMREPLDATRAQSLVRGCAARR